MIIAGKAKCRLFLLGWESIEASTLLGKECGIHAKAFIYFLTQVECFLFQIIFPCPLNKTWSLWFVIASYVWFSFYILYFFLDLNIGLIYSLDFECFLTLWTSLIHPSNKLNLIQYLGQSTWTLNTCWKHE